MTNVLILGGGFGGVRAALDLNKRLKSLKDVKITLIDKNDSQTFFPALYEVASVFGVNHQHPFHTKLRGTVSIPYSEIFGGTKVELVQAEINHVDIEAGHVVTANGATIPFDYLVIALGAAASTFGVPGAEEYAFKFKSIEDGLMLSDKLEELFNAAANGERPLPINILIGGAGFTGVELAAELSNCTARIAHRHGITKHNCAALSLIEASPMMLPMVSDEERNKIKNRLLRLGVNIMENSPITEVMTDSVKLKNGKVLRGDIIVWSAGVKSLELFRAAKGLELDDKGRIPVNEFMQVRKYNNVFAIGDNIIFIDPKTQKPVPQMAFVAIEQGSIAAENITRLINSQSSGKPVPALKIYKPSYDVWVAPVGGKYAVAHVGKWGIGGFLGYVAREMIDFRYFVSTLPFFKAIKLFFEEAKVFSKND